MTTDQKQYIEQNMTLIEDNNWGDFFRHSPDGTGDVLYAAGIDFMSEMKAVPRTCFANSNIDSIVIPDGVTSIDHWAFFKCLNLTNITIPDSVTSIEQGAFSSCSSLKSITIPNSVTSIGISAFYNCTSLTSITIPDSVTFLSTCSFEDCSSLTNVTISNSITEIDDRAFNGCRSLRTVNFTGTIEQWRQIIQRKYVFNNVPARKVTCTDGIANLRR